MEAKRSLRATPMRAPLQAIRIEETRVVRRACPLLSAVAASRGIDAGQRARAGRRRPRTVRAMGPAVSWLWAMGMMPGAADQAQRGLDPDQAVGVRGADDGAVGLGADGRRAEAGRHRRARARAGAAGVAVERVGVAALAAARRSSRWTSGCERKLAHSLRLALPSSTAPAARSRSATKAVAGRDRAFESQRARGGGHAVGGVDVVLEEDGHAVQRPARSAGLPLGVERVGDGQRLGVGLDDAAQGGAPAIEPLDAVEVGLDQLPAPSPGRCASAPAGRRWRLPRRRGRCRRVRPRRPARRPTRRRPRPRPAAGSAAVRPSFAACYCRALCSTSSAAGPKYFTTSRFQLGDLRMLPRYSLSAFSSSGESLETP